MCARREAKRKGSMLSCTLLFAAGLRCSEPPAKALRWYEHKMFGHVDPSLSLQPALTGRWLVLVGDSTLRMSYHLLRGHMASGWTQWPVGGDNHGLKFNNMSAKHDCELANHAEYKWVNESSGAKSSRSRYVRIGAAKCIEHAFHNGSLISFVWLDVFDVDQLAPLKEFARDVAQGRPDGLALSAGAWTSSGSLSRERSSSPGESEPPS